VLLILLLIAGVVVWSAFERAGSGHAQPHSQGALPGNSHRRRPQSRRPCRRTRRGSGSSSAGHGRWPFDALVQSVLVRAGISALVLRVPRLASTLWM